MTQYLFVYGTLVPGEPNEHILAPVNGTWQAGSITGTLHHIGWGAELGYPAVDLEQGTEEIWGMLFTSDELAEHWERLDEFEGEAYQRVLTTVTLKNGQTLEAFVYALRKSKLDD